MLNTLFAKLPGSVIFKALQDGEPMAYVMVAGVILLIIGAFTVKHLMAQASE